MSGQDWCRNQFPSVEIVWVESYFVAVDRLLGMPIFAGSPTLASALEKKLFIIVGTERAKELNDTFAADGEWAERYLADELDARWRIIAMQAFKSAGEMV